SRMCGASVILARYNKVLRTDHMARAKQSGNGQIEQALATLINNQAAFVAQLRESEQRFSRIEATLAEHSRILADHGRILAEHTHLLGDIMSVLHGLPDAIRDKIG